MNREGSNMLWPERSIWGPEEARVGGFPAPGVADPRLNPIGRSLPTLCFRSCMTPLQPLLFIVQYTIPLTIHNRIIDAVTAWTRRERRDIARVGVKGAKRMLRLIVTPYDSPSSS